MVALIHNHVAIVDNEIFDCPFMLQTLNYGNINQTGSLGFSSAELSDVPNRQIQKTPLIVRAI